MKHLFLLTSLLLFHFFASAQRMNAYGHFPQGAGSLWALSRAGNPGLDTLGLAGTSVFRAAHGYLTLEGLYENAPVQLRMYSPEGELRYQKEFRQAINPCFSPSRRYMAFYDKTHLQVFNTTCLTSKTMEGSTVFAVDDQMNVASYHEAAATVHYKDQSLPAPEQMYRVVIHQGMPLFLGYRQVWKWDSTGLEAVFTAPEGRVFDLMVDSATLHVSTKVEQPCQFVFTEYIGQHLRSFQAQPSVTFPLAHCNHAPPPASQERTTTNETIRNPLHFYQAIIYQPVGNSYNEIQEYTPGSPYPHPGVDLLGNFQDTVYSVKNGVVKAILTTSAQYHWRVAIANSATSGRSQGYLYAHVDEFTIPYAVGDPVNEGDAVGYLVDWPVAGFTHCHFARISDQGTTWSGNWWTFDNPLKFITNITDHLPPTFEFTKGNDKFAFRDAGGTYLSPSNLYGNVRVIAKFYDRINTTDWHVDVDKVRYSLSPLATPTQMLLDTHAQEYNHWNDEYFSGPYSQQVLNTLYSRDATCFSLGDYDFREFYHIVTNSDGNDTITAADMQQFFRTADYPNGDYIFRVTAMDPFGLATTDSMIITVQNPSVDVTTAAGSGIKVYPNPSREGLFHVTAARPVAYEVWDGLGKRLAVGRLSTSMDAIDLGGHAAGMYLLRITDGEVMLTERLMVGGN